MANYQRLKKVLSLCKTSDRWDQKVNLHRDGYYCFLGFASMLAVGLDPLQDDFKSRVNKGEIPTIEKARDWLELSLFESALLWSYFDGLTIDDLSELVMLFCVGRTFKKDNQIYSKSDLIQANL